MTQPKHTLNIAHRGARSLAPENTLASARKGLEIGADMWELDVAMTQDGELVVLHDDTPERTSNVAAIFPDRKSAPVYQFTLAELRKLDFGSWFIQQDPFKQIAAGAVSQAELEKFKGEPIPTLREALAFTRDNHWKVNVEIKSFTGAPPDATIVQKTVAMIGEMGMTGQVIVSSFNHAYIQTVKKLNPAIVTAALVEKADPDPAALLRQTGAQAYNPDVRVISPAAIRPLREQGFDVYIYTVNDPSIMKTLIEAGASGLFTDFPQLLKSVLDTTY
jgi:glycerophosphoryl diester phosphodiesterase